MSKKLTGAQKQYNALLQMRYRTAGKIAVLEERLSDARDELHEVDKKLTALRSPARQSLELTEHEKALVRSQNLIQAIKDYRGRHQNSQGQYIGLKEAKDAVDAYAYECGARVRPTGSPY